MRIRMRIVPVVLLVLAALAAGCRSDQTTPIKTLLDDPSRFDGRRVAIQGDVTKAYGVMNYGVYQVDDGTGSIGIATTTNGTPRVGAHVGVVGTFRSAFTIGTETAAMIQESKRFTPGKTP